MTRLLLLRQCNHALEIGRNTYSLKQQVYILPQSKLCETLQKKKMLYSNTWLLQKMSSRIMMHGGHNELLAAMHS